MKGIKGESFYEGLVVYYVWDFYMSSLKPSKIHEAKIVVALVELVNITMCARNPTKLHKNFHSHLVAHNIIHCFNFDSHVVVAMEPNES
jgi:hypothetical protein